MNGVVLDTKTKRWQSMAIYINKMNLNPKYKINEIDVH